jgi:hypothetical protein
MTQTEPVTGAEFCGVRVEASSDGHETQQES